MRRTALPFFLSTLLAIFFVALPTHADDKGGVAQELFDAAMALTKQNKYADACPKFEESRRLDEQVGTLYYLADCQEHIGLLASAWANFVLVADKATAIQKPSHAKEAQGRADALKVRLNKLLILVPDEIAKAPGFAITRGEVLLGAAQLGVPLPVDNGKHVIKVSAAGRKAWSTTVEVAGESSTITVSVPPLMEEPVVGPVVSTRKSANSIEPKAPESAWNPPRKVAVGIGSIGIAGVVLGGVFGGIAVSKADASQKFCLVGANGAPDRCLAEGGKLREEARAFANRSNTALITGATLIAAGIVIWIVAPEADAPAAITKEPAAKKVGFSLGIQGETSTMTIQLAREW